MPIDAVNSTSYSQPIQRQQAQSTVSNYIEEPSEDKNNKKALIAVGAALALVTLGVLGHQGYLGKGIQKTLGGAKKAGEKGAKETGETADRDKEEKKEEIKKTFNELYNNAIKEKKTSIKNEITGKTHSFEYAENGELLKETITLGDDYAIYENINGKMRIVKAKKGEIISLRHFNENGTVSRLKPEVPVKEVPSLTYKGELPQTLTTKEIPGPIDKDFIDKLPMGESLEFGEYYKSNHSIYKSYKDKNGVENFVIYDLNGKATDIVKTVKDSEGRTIGEARYNPFGKRLEIKTYEYDADGNNILRGYYLGDGKLESFNATTNDGNTIWLKSDGTRYNT